jgi:hypothetical protein
MTFVKLFLSVSQKTFGESQRARSQREASKKLSRRETRSANSTRSAKPAKLSRLSERDHELSEREDRHGKTITLPMTRSMLLGFS